MPVYLLFGWAIFDDWDGFIEALRYYLTPDFWSWIRGEGIDDWWAEFKVAAFIIACGAAVVGEWYLIRTWWG